MKQIPAPFWTLVVGIVVTLISLWVGQNNHWLPEQASAQAPLVDDFFNVMVTIGTALFIVVEGTIIFCLIKFRRPAGDNSDGLPIEGNLPLEAFWTAIPAVIVIGLGIYSVLIFQDMGGFSPGGHNHGTLMAHAPTPTTTDVGSGMLAQSEPGSPVKSPVYGFGASPLEGADAPDLTVNVTGMQYAWIFRYPDSGITDGELHVPVGKDVQLNIQGQDVIHSFWVPQFRLKQDAIPGESTELRFVATKPGTYPVVCAELCGAYHGAMRTQVIVQTEAEYADWVTSRVAQTPAAQPPVSVAATRSDADYLAAYSEAIEIDPHLISHLASDHSLSSH